MRTTICATIDAATYGTGAVDASSAILSAINGCAFRSVQGCLPRRGCSARVAVELQPAGNVRICRERYIGRECLNLGFLSLCRFGRENRIDVYELFVNLFER